MMDTERFHGARILIVDDEEPNVRLLERMLLQAGYTIVRGITDPREAIAAFRDLDPDLVLLDLGMPHRDGFEVMEELRRMTVDHAYLPILVLTGDATREASRRALSSGATDFLTKPLDRAEVLLRIRNLLETRFLYLDLERRNRQLEDEFHQAQKMEAVGRLAGGIAHDFNNLLSVIGGYTAMALAEVKEEDPLRRYLEQIHWASDRSAALTRQLLAFSRRQVLQPKVLDLNTVVGEMDKMLRRLIGDDIELLTTLDPELGLLRADPGQIEQVLMNLAVNARDAMPTGGRLTIETRNVELDEAAVRDGLDLDPGDHVLLTVSDTGTGMPPEVIERIFEPFFTTKEKGKGTGLGLSTVYGIVKQSGGDLSVRSELGRGTTFRVHLPRIRGLVAEQTAIHREPAEHFSGTETILLVEDEPAVRMLAARILTKKGYTVLDAANGGEALLISEGHEGRIDLVLTDVAMPRMNGTALADRLRRTRPDTPILYMSGNAEDALVHLGVVAPGATLLEKPFTPDSLAYKVREVLDAMARSASRAPVRGAAVKTRV